MSWSTELYVVSRKPGKEYSKSLELNEIKDYLEITQLSKSYDDYVAPNLLYFTEDLTKLAKELSVESIRPKGLYIMGIYGGEKKKEKEMYAGIALHEYSYDDIRFRFRLWRTKDLLEVPVSIVKKYGVEVFSVVYEGEINPFKLRKYVPVILSKTGEESLKSFLREALNINISKIVHKDTVRMIEALISEVKQPSLITPLNVNKYYVAYRCDRAFTAFAFKPQHPNIIIESHVAYIESSEEKVAYYYAAILNYLAYKVTQLGRAFIRHQFARPLLAVYMAGLVWKDVDEDTRLEVVKCSKVLHEKALNKEYSNQRVALKDVERLSEFKKLVEILDAKVSKENLEIALGMVSGKGVEEENEG